MVVAPTNTKSMRTLKSAFGMCHFLIQRTFDLTHLYNTIYEYVFFLSQDLGISIQNNLGIILMPGSLCITATHHKNHRPRPDPFTYYTKVQGCTAQQGSEDERVRSTKT